MDARAAGRPHELRLLALVVVGTLAGIVFVVYDVLSESRLRSGTLTGFAAAAHAVCDHSLPILAGAALGVCVHYLRVRSELASALEAAARAEALRARLQKVERDQAVWVLVAAVLHQLKNPLHALGLLLDELAEARDDGRRNDLLSRVRAQCERALSSLEALRSMRSLGEPEMERVALDRIVASIASDVAPLAAEDGLDVRLDCGEPVAASADPQYVRTILENLLDNSIQALRGAGGGRITIRVGSEGGKAVVRVTDDGPAIDREVRASLFEPLRTTKTQGLGLGLPIARALARAMRGDVALDESDASKAFRLELPLRSAP